MKKVMMVIILILLLIGGIFGYLVYSDLKEEEILKNEIEKIESSDFLKDEIDMNIKTSGDYEKLEENVKKYVKNYSEEANNLKIKLENKKYTEVLTITNIQKDMPEFKSSEVLIKEIKNLNEEVYEFIKKSEKEKIIKFIEDENLKTYYTDMYEDIMLNGVIKTKMEAISSELKIKSDKLKSYAETYTNVINFLKNNNGKWEIINNQLYFSDQALLDEYNKISGKIV